MVAIKDMKMPKSCNDCEFNCKHYEFNCHYYSYCQFDKNAGKKLHEWLRDLLPEEGRASICPLVEIVTCKDCIHRDEYGCRHGHPNCKDNFYCADAERRVKNEK